MNTVYLFFENENIRIPFFDYDKGLFDKLIKSRMGRWENKDQQYHISRSKYDPDQIKTILDGRAYVEVGREPDNPVLVSGFFKGGMNEPDDTIKVAPESEPVANITVPVPNGGLPDQFPDHYRDKLETEMRSRKFSDHTRSAYINPNKALCRWLQKPPEDVTSDDIKRYLAYLDQIKKYSASTMNSNLSAFKFFYNQVLKRDTAREQKRPRQDKRLPVVFSKSEMIKIFDSVQNPKHRLLLMIGFASGLRVGELVNLRRQDMDLSRRLIRVFDGKGRKDRDTIMSETVYVALNYYYTRYKITGWLFPGADPKHHLSIRTAQHIFKNTLRKAGIDKNASIHSLRHSFATHLLESGYDITYIKELMGHGSIRTTERYTHVAKRKALNAISPLDTIDQEDKECEEIDYSEKQEFNPKFARWSC